MGRFTTSLAMGVVAVCCLLCPPVALAEPGESDPAATEMLRLGLRGVYFVPNQGQWADDGVMYGLRSRGLDVAFRESSLTMHLAREVESTSRAREEAVLDVERDAPLAHTRGSSGESADLHRLTLTITFPGSNAVTPVGGNPQAAKFNYFVGGEGRETASDVPSFGEVVYENLYDGVDLHVMGNDDGVLKYEFHCAPGADFSQIRIAYDGIESLCIDEAGNLQISTSFGTLADGAPVVWQEDSTSRADASTSAREEAVLDVERDAPLAHTRGSSDHAIPARFELSGNCTYRIALDGPIDPTRELIIDPELQWMTYLGGADREWGYAVAVDAADNAYLTGETASFDFAGRMNEPAGFNDAFIVRVNSQGAVDWMTYLGGSRGEAGAGIAVDASGDVLVAGSTNSPDFAGRTNEYLGEGDAFLTRVSSGGVVEWMEYLGGSGADWASGVAIDAGRLAFVSGTTTSIDLPASNNSNHGVTDAFIARIDPQGALNWTTYLGGTDHEHAFGLAIDQGGSAYLVGETISRDFAQRNNSFYGGDGDAFVARVDPTGLVEWMSYLGGGSIEEARGVAVDAADQALIAGWTRSDDFFGQHNSSNGRDAFVVKISSVGELAWMSYVDQRGEERAYGVAVDPEYSAIVTGTTTYPGQDVLIAKVASDGEIRWVDSIGGSEDDAALAIALAHDGEAILTGWTMSSDFDWRTNELHGGSLDALVMRVNVQDRATLACWSNCDRGGSRITISWRGATPSGPVVLFFAAGEGSYFIPSGHPCAGTRLGLGPGELRVVWQGRSREDGTRFLDGTIPPPSCWHRLQLLDLSTCLTSNTTPIP